jgi:hypothetical protein
VVKGPRSLEARIWVFLFLPLGAALAVLSLEVIGIPLVVVALGPVLWAGRRTFCKEADALSAGYVPNPSMLDVVMSWMR